MPAVVSIARAVGAGAAGALAAVALASCGGGEVLPGAQPDHGKQLIQFYGCGACHTIDGIDTANGKVGPNLTNFSSNRYVAGNLPNTPDNVERWIEDPHRYEPKTIMPNLGITPRQAADIVAYLEGQ